MKNFFRSVKENLKAVIFILVLLLIVFSGIIWNVFQWNECRDMDHSFMYCVAHIL